MAKRKSTTKPSNQAIKASPSATDSVEGRVVAFAEQLGRIVGSVQARTEGWLDRETLNEQLTRVRDGASVLLNQIESAAASAAASASAAVAAGRKMARGQSKKAKAAPRTTRSTGRSGGTVDAPRKSHRKAPPAARSVKHSNEMIPKAASAKAARTRRRG